MSKTNKPISPLTLRPIAWLTEMDSFVTLVSKNKKIGYESTSGLKKGDKLFQMDGRPVNRKIEWFTPLPKYIPHVEHFSYQKAVKYIMDGKTIGINTGEDYNIVYSGCEGATKLLQSKVDGNCYFIIKDK